MYLLQPLWRTSSMKKNIEKELGALILTGEYQPETPRIDELAMDGLREDDDDRCFWS